MHTNFNGIIKEICEQYPNVDLPGYLADNLQLPLDKAEVLAARIEKQICQKISESKEQKILRILEKTVEEPSKICGYHVDCLASKEFEYFIKWLLGELGFEAQPDMFAATNLGVDVVANKENEKVAIQAVRCSHSHKATETIVHMAQQTRGDCSKALVIATTYFTEQAKIEAEKLGIELWDIDSLNQKIAEAKERVDLEMQPSFPQYKGSLFQSLLALTDTKNFLIETKAEGKYDVHLPGVKYPLLTFQSQNGLVTRCICRIKYNEPVTENDGETIITTDETNNRVGPDEEQAYGLVMQYLEQFLE